MTIPFQIIIDTREQRPYPIRGAITGTLPTGDYSFVGGGFGIERSVWLNGEIYGKFGIHHDRFRREMERASQLLEFVNLVECTVEEILHPEWVGSQIHRNAVIGAINSYRKKFGIKWVFCGTKNKSLEILEQNAENRKRGQRYVETYLRQRYDEWQAGLWQKRPVELLDLSPWDFTRDKIRFAKKRIRKIEEE